MAIATPEPMNDVAIASTGATYKVITKKGMIHGNTVIVTGGIVRDPPKEPEPNPEWDPLPMLPFVDRRDLDKVLSCISRHIIRTAGEPSIAQVEWMHMLWKAEREEAGCKIDHPLKSVVQAWIITHNAKHITTAYDSLHPASIIKNPDGQCQGD